MWTNNLISFVLGVVFCLLLTPAFGRFGAKMHIYSAPGGRHINKLPIPRMGGASVFTSFTLTLCVFLYIKDLFSWNLFRGSEQFQLLFVLLCCAACVWLLGLFDDIRHLRARYKLLIQIGVAAIAYSLGLQIHTIHFPVLGILNLGDYSLLFTVLWIVGTINAVNFIDGVDGLCSGVIVCSILGILFLAMFYGDTMGAIVCSALVGCIMAFLIFNSPPASIFLGDSGAYFLGFMVAGLPVFIASNSSSPAVFNIAFILFLFVPLTDTSLAILRRMIMNVPMFTPDRGHLHHRLLDRGYTYKKVTLTISFISLVFVIVGVMVAIGNLWQTVVALLIGAGTVYLLLRLCDISSMKKLKPGQARNITKGVLLKEYAPALFHDLTGAGDWVHARKSLDDFSRNTEMCWAKIACQKNGSNNVVWEWRNEMSSPCRRQPQLCKTYEVLHNDICYQFCFCWDSEYNNVQNDTDALLDVVSNTVGRSIHEKFFSQDNAVFEKSDNILLSRSGISHNPRSTRRNTADMPAAMSPIEN